MSGKFGGAAEICPVCTEKVYAMDRFVIEKMVIHKACFKCKHCGGKLGLSNFAAVNQQVYCKTHYLQLFRESGGRYDKAFGDGGFERTSSEVGYTPGQFKGIGAKSSAPAGVSGVKVKEVMKKFQDVPSPTSAPKPEVSKKPAVAAAAVEEEAPSSVSDRKSAYLAAVGAGGSSGSLNSSFESSPSNSPSSASFRSSADRKNAYLAAMAQTNGTTKPALDASTGMSVSQRIKNYSSTASSLKEPDAAAPPPPSKLADRLQQYVSNAQAGTSKEEAETSPQDDDDDEDEQQHELDEQQQQRQEEEDGQVA